jgi:CO/xanthine dehydrogenase FAD-binding subunit
VLLNLREHLRPGTIREAVRLLREGAGRTVALAGGTELVGRQDPATEAVVDLSGLGLAGVGPGPARGLAIGAMTTLQALAADQGVHAAAGGILARAAAMAAPATIRAAATLGGTLAGEKGGEEIPTALLALGARVALAAPDLVEVPMAAFLRDREELLAWAPLILRVVIPAQALCAAGGCARVSRSPADRAIVCAAAVAFPGGEVSLAVGGVERRPRMAAASDEPFARWDAVGDHRASTEYRCTVAPVLARRAVLEATGGAVR